METVSEVRRSSALRSWALAGSGGAIAAVGCVWWTWDADPTRGRLLVFAGLLITAAGYVLLSRKPSLVPIWVTTVVAALLVVVAGYELWQAITTIASQAASRAV